MDNFYLRSITEYCERVSVGFLSEPFNLISNFAFFVSAIFLYRLTKQEKIKGFQYKLPLFLVIFIGIGSSLWHSIRNPFTNALDAIPIFIFFLILVFLLLKNLLQNNKQSFLITTSFLFLQIVVSYLFPNFLNGSIRHFINGLTFIILIFWINKKYKRININILIAFTIYIFAIVFRSIDNNVCPVFPVGTHFLWHIFNSIAVYFAVKGLFFLRHPQGG